MRRGQHDEAYLAARDSHGQSIRFVEQAREDLHEAECDLRSQHWASVVSPRLALTEALSHIIERIDVERRLKELVDGSRRADDEDYRWIPRIVELLDDCLARHQALQQVIAEARDAFLLEHERQHLISRERRSFPIQSMGCSLARLRGPAATRTR